MTLPLLSTVSVLAAQADTSLLLDAGVALIGVVSLAALGLLWRLNDRVGQMNGILSHPQLGLVALFGTMDARLRAVENALARADD